MSRLFNEFWNEFRCAFGFHDWHQIRAHGQIRHFNCLRPGCNAEKWEWNNV